ncbi:hypothetical protein WA577_006580 [Blastocystis sp. JDR]
MESSEDYVPKNILITGGAGFIASHVVILLAKKYPDYKIVNMDCLDYCASLKNLDEVKDLPNYRFVEGNILSSSFVSYVLKTEEIDTVLHFAAQSHVDNSFGNSLAFTYNNVVGTHVLLEACRMHGIKRFIHVSTDEVYGEQREDQENVQEDALLNPTNPYAATKAAAEFIVKGYQHSYHLPVIVTRSNNVYGPHQYPEKVVPKFINLVERDRPMTIHGTGKNLRTFLYVKDVAKAFDLILHKGKTFELYNIAGKSEVSVCDVAKEVWKLMKKEGKVEDHMVFVRDREFNDFRYAINGEKLEKLGWKATTTFEEGMKETVAWYLSHPNQWENYEAALDAHPTLVNAYVNPIVL